METREAITLDARAQQRLYLLAGELTGEEAATFRLKPAEAFAELVATAD